MDVNEYKRNFIQVDQHHTALFKIWE